MSTRTLPPPDIFASCPLDGKVLEYYSGTFEAVYISLNPFIQPISIEKAQFRPGSYPDRFSIVANCKPVSWSDVAQLGDLRSLAAVDIGLRTGIGGLKAELQNKDFAAAIDGLWDTKGILAPSEGVFPDLLYDKILRSIQELGYEWVWVGDEFCTERKLHWIDDIKNEDCELTRGRYNVFTPDKQFLWTIHWDSHFSFLCSSAENLKAVTNMGEIEGFFCDLTTEVYWSVL